MITDEFTYAYTLCVTILRRNEITRKEGACYRCFSSPLHAKCVCLKLRVNVRETERETEGAKRGMERMWKTPKVRAEKYKRINARFSLVYWYNRTGLSDVVPSFRLQTLPKSFSSFHVPDRSFFEPQNKRLNMKTPSRK